MNVDIATFNGFDRSLHSFNSTSFCSTPEVMAVNTLDNVFYGPIVDIPVGNESLGERLFTSLVRLPEDLVLLIDGETGKEMTASELMKLSISFAESLKKSQFKVGDVVAMVGENTIDLCIAAVGAIMAGGIMAPIDPQLKSYEFQHLLEIMQPTIIVCDNDVIPEVNDAVGKLGLNVQFIAVGVTGDDVAIGERFENLITNSIQDQFCPSPCKSSQDVAVVVCSSGSTGLPKGVSLSHASLIFQLEVVGEMFNRDIILHTSYFYWISGVILLLISTNFGAPRVLLRTTDTLTILKTIEKYKIASSALSPSLLATVLNFPGREEYDISSMKLLLVGGSPLLKGLTDLIAEVLPESTLIQGYGATEVGGIVTQSKPPVDIMSVGTPTTNTKVKIIDRNTGEALGPSKEGEIVCWAPSVMVGYFNNEEATRDAIDDDGWYHTGDIGRFTEEGVLYITGRAKELLKVENHQISPSEIEDVISTVSGVLDVVVVGIPVDENSYPMALVVKHDNSNLCEDDIYLAVKENLSEFKQLRAGVFFIDTVPRTPTGKIKRRLAQPIAESLYQGLVPI